MWIYGRCDVHTYMHLRMYLVVLSRSYTGEDLWITVQEFGMLSVLHSGCVNHTRPVNTVNHAYRFNHSSFVLVVHFVISFCRRRRRSARRILQCIWQRLDGHRTIWRVTQNHFYASPPPEPDHSLHYQPELVRAAATEAASWQLCSWIPQETMGRRVLHWCCTNNHCWLIMLPNEDMAIFTKFYISYLSNPTWLFEFNYLDWAPTLKLVPEGMSSSSTWFCVAWTVAYKTIEYSTCIGGRVICFDEPFNRVAVR